MPNTRLKQICQDACESALSTVTFYDHSETQRWNDAIINSILKALISETATASPDQQSKYKFAVNSTIIQHLSDPPSTAQSDAGSEATTSKTVGRRGMHSASGAYWNNEKDGMWSFKWAGGEAKGMDIVISVMWIAV